MSAGFTPGPWLTDGIQFEGLGQRVWRNSDDDSTTVAWIETPRDSVSIHHGTRIANASLIAAAPDLYAALEGVALIYHALHTSGGIDPAGSAALRKARAALAKARGEAS